MTIQDKEKIITQWKYKYNLLPSAHRASSILLDKGEINDNRV